MNVLLDSLLSLLIIIAIVVVFYLKIAKKTFNEMVRDLIELFKSSKEQLQ